MNLRHVLPALSALPLLALAGPVGANPPPYLPCASSCEFVVCSGPVCRILRCDAFGCHVLTTWPGEDRIPEAARARRAPGPAPAAATRG